LVARSCPTAASTDESTGCMRMLPNAKSAPQTHYF
jgi:hypothetical protein